jgi:hypothetical protein
MPLADTVTVSRSYGARATASSPATGPNQRERIRMPAPVHELFDLDTAADLAPVHVLHAAQATSLSRRIRLSPAPHRP